MRGTGPDGAILAEDVLALAKPQSAPEHTDIEKLGPVGRLMAERTTQSWTTVPHFFVLREIDAGSLVGIREKLAAGIESACGVRPTHTDFLVALVARVLVKHPRVNGSWTGEGIRINKEVPGHIANRLQVALWRDRQRLLLRAALVAATPRASGNGMDGKS